MGFKKPYFVGIVGGSCAGKTWLAEKLHDCLGRDCSARLSMDDFYIDRKHLTDRQAELVNFDHPRSIDWKRFERTLSDFAQGKAVRTPRYDFSTHSRLEGEVELQAAPIVITEGLWLLRRNTVRKLMDLRIFIQSEAGLCERRRVERDTRERGRQAEQVLAQYRGTVAPSFNKFVRPQQRWANLILETVPDEGTVEAIATRIARERNGRPVSL